MSYAILLYFDPQTEAVVNELMQALSEHVGVGELLPTGFRPHLTLTGFEGTLPRGFIGKLGKFASQTAPMPITLSAAGAFPTDQGVVYLAPVVTIALLELHHEFYPLLESFGIEGNPYFAPDTWIPHCSVAYGLGPDKAGRAIAMILEREIYLSGELVAIGLTEFLPIKELCIYPLAGGSEE